MHLKLPEGPLQKNEKKRSVFCYWEYKNSLSRQSDQVTTLPSQLNSFNSQGWIIFSFSSPKGMLKSLDAGWFLNHATWNMNSLCLVDRKVLAAVVTSSRFWVCLSNTHSLSESSLFSLPRRANVRLNERKGSIRGQKASILCRLLSPEWYQAIYWLLIAEKRMLKHD